MSGGVLWHDGRGIWRMIRISIQTFRVTDSILQLLKKGRMFFFEKKNQKTFDTLGRDSPAACAKESKCFGAFFQARTLTFLP
jgi:hypothetical protein